MNAPRWCAACGTRHDLGPDCPGELLASEPERAGFRISVQTATRRETYGVLIAPSGDWWRARILTLPNMLWSIPGGRGTMKFLGGSPAEAEALARDFILRFVKARGYTAEQPDTLAPTGPVEPEAAPGAAADDERTRFLHSIVCRYGEQRATESAATADLSARGLFVITNRPLPQGASVKLVLELEHASLPLNGVVAWVRPTPEDGRQAGMGVQLINPPALYRHYLTRLK